MDRPDYRRDSGQLVCRWLPQQFLRGSGKEQGDRQLALAIRVGPIETIPNTVLAGENLCQLVLAIGRTGTLAGDRRTILQLT